MGNQTFVGSQLQNVVGQEIVAAGPTPANWSEVTAPVLVVQRALQNVSNNSFGDWAGGLANIIAQGTATARKQFPDATWAVRAAVADGDRVTFQYTAKGTDATTGRVVSWSGSAVAQVDGNQIGRLLAWNEDSAVRQLQLGQTIRVGAGVVSGAWMGATAGVGFRAQLQHDDSTGEVWGTVDIANVGTFAATGTMVGTQLNLSATSASGRAVQFSGTLANGTVAGLVAGHNEPVTLYRA